VAQLPRLRGTAVRVAALGIAIGVTIGAGFGVATSAAADESSGTDVTAEGTLAAAATGSGAVTYNPAVAPVGAHLSVDVDDDGSGGTKVTLDVEGLLPDRGYAAHAHAYPCGATPAAAGPHFQDKADPAATPTKPSSDPQYANPENEVWLELHTDAGGDGHAEADVPFVFAENRSPRSVVIHEAQTTATDAGHAGTAGARAACITLPTS
jgi:Cu-Zn family superoxide dismutase